MSRVSRGCLPCRTRRVKVSKPPLFDKPSAQVAISVTKAVLRAADVINAANSVTVTVMSRRSSFVTKMTRPRVDQFDVPPLHRPCQLQLQAKCRHFLAFHVDFQAQTIHLSCPPQKVPDSMTPLHTIQGPRMFPEPQNYLQRIRLSPNFSRNMSCILATTALRLVFSNTSLACSRRSKQRGNQLCGGLFAQLHMLVFPTIRAIRRSVTMHYGAMGGHYPFLESLWRILKLFLMTTH